uniref:M-phase phosphoprotein 9 n=1 Tax=Neogobius melanostomus TaxID=47308 RepID=A0A8C6T6Y9_9GOBI
MPVLMGTEDKQTASQTTGGTVQYRPVDITAHKEIRDICLRPDVFEHGKNLPFINPTSIETLRALVQEIRSSGETNPELWKDCEGRWLHLFQLVEKQYQEQILAQQEQYQCHIQLIQDEIKALVQIQNRQPNVQPQKDLSKANVTEGCDYPTISTHCSNDNSSVKVCGIEVQEATMLSSGYGTMCTWESGIVTHKSAQEDKVSECRKKLPFFLNSADENQNAVKSQPKNSSAKKPGLERVTQQSNQQITFSTNQQLTSWVQRNKLRPKRNKTMPLSMKLTENEALHKKHVESHQPIQVKSTDSLDQHQPGGPLFNSYVLRRSDSLISETSGLTYWRLHENDLYHPLPDSFDSGVPHLKEESMSFIPHQLSLKEIYCNKQDCKQAFSMDPVTTRQSDHTSGFTSPSHFSSPSFSTPSHFGHRAETPITPDSMVESSHIPGDTDCLSDASSVSAARHATLKVQDQWGALPLTAKHNTSHHQAYMEKEQGWSQRYPNTPQTEGSASLEDPVILSLLRQNLREKHSRHVADLKSYYESEIQNLVDKLQLKDLPKDIERCKHLEKALTDATSRNQELEANNNSLEKKITEWSERYAVAGATVKSLSKRLEESKHSAKEKDALVVRLKIRIQQLEEAAQKAEREADEKEAKREREYKMLQDLLGEYDSLMKAHEGLKVNLVSTENKLVDALDQISELKKNISKMESQVKQLEHENQARVRCSSHNTQPSGAGLYHHPDLLLSPTKGNAVPDVTRTCSHSPSEQNNDAASLIQTNKSIKSLCNKFSNILSGHERPIDVAISESWNSPDCELSQSRFQEESCRPKEVSRRQGSCVMTPMMRAIVELEETRATQSRAPWVENSKSTFGFVEQRLKVPIQNRDIPQDLSKSLRRAEKSRVGALQRSLSPESHRSSSLPPPAQRNILPTTPSKRETLLMPLSAKSSPKRCPTENFSTAFGHLMPREEHLHHSPRKRLHFTAADQDVEQHTSDSASDVQPRDVNPQLDWDERDDNIGLSHLDRLQSLSDAERLFDELTQEKLQIEAALRRIPGTGSRVSLQTRLDEVALEKRLERLNQDLGSLRMTLKRFHVLRSSANL